MHQRDVAARQPSQRPNQTGRSCRTGDEAVDGRVHLPESDKSSRVVGRPVVAVVFGLAAS